jgi:hypothetical protein
MEHRIYEVIEKNEYYAIGDEVVLVEESYPVGLAQRITLAKKDGIFKTDDRKSYWFGSPNWIPLNSIEYLRTE